MDKRNRLTYMMVEAAVDKGIKDIQENAYRGVRNLVDLGEHFATGRFQKDFYDIAQQMLKNKNSVYYEILDNLIKNVDHKIIKHFGINLGYNSWTYGAKKIREYEKEYRYNVPWTIVFDFRNETENMLTAAEVSDILNTCESIGIYSGMFFTGKDEKLVDDLVKVLSSHKDGAFFLLVEPELVTDELASEVNQASNIVLSMEFKTSGENTECKNAADRLLRRKCLYGVYSMYDSGDIEYLMSDSYTSQISNLHCTFAFLVRKANDEALGDEKLSGFTTKYSDPDGYPFLLFDFYKDIARVDMKISVEECFLCIKSDGKIAVGNMDTMGQVSDIRSSSLKNILKETMPGIRYI